MYWSAGSSSTNVALAGVATPARRITSLAYAFDDSSLAAAALGPNTARPSWTSRSARPAASGASGPMIVRSICCSVTAATNSSIAVAAMRRFVASCAVPGFPGAANSSRSSGGAEAAESRCNASRAHARARRSRQPVLSPLLECVRERLGGPLGGVHHVVHDGLRFLHIVIAGLIDVFVDRPVFGIGPAAGVLAVQDAVVCARFDPALQLRGAQRV